MVSAWCKRELAACWRLWVRAVTAGAAAAAVDAALASRERVWAAAVRRKRAAAAMVVWARAAAVSTTAAQLVAAEQTASDMLARQRQAAAVHLLAKWLGLLTAKCVRRWRRYASTAAIHRAKHSFALLQRLRRYYATVLHTWWGQTAARQAQERLEDRATRRLIRFKTAAVLRCWVAACRAGAFNRQLQRAEQAEQRLAGLEALLTTEQSEHTLMATKLMALEEADQRQHEKQVETTMRRVMIKMDQSLSSQAFGSWRESTEALIRARNLMAKAVARIEHAAVAQSFIPWLGAAREAAELARQEIAASQHASVVSAVQEAAAAERAAAVASAKAFAASRTQEVEVALAVCRHQAAASPFHFACVSTGRGRGSANLQPLVNKVAGVRLADQLRTTSGERAKFAEERAELAAALAEAKELAAAAEAEGERKAVAALQVFPMVLQAAIAIPAPAVS